MQTIGRSPDSGEHFLAEEAAFRTAALGLAAKWNMDWIVAGRLVAAALVPGIPFIAARILLHQHSGIVNLDYLLLSVLACAWSVRVASVLFVLTYLLECMHLVDAIYFFTQQDVAFAFHFLGEVPKWLVVAWVLAFVAVTALFLKVWRMLLPRVSGPRLWRATGVLAVLSIAFAMVDVSQGFNPMLRLPHAAPRHHMVGELLVRVPLELAHNSGKPESAAPLSQSATGLLWGNGLVRQRRENVVVVAVESMGLLEDEAGREKELSILTDDSIRQHYVVSEGTVPFTGGTVAGEMRELCHLATGVHITSATLAGRAPCLPQQFRELGYQTASYHGFRGAMFLRED